MLKRCLSAVVIAMGAATAAMVIAASSAFATDYRLITNNPVGSGIDRVLRKLSQIVKTQSDIDLIVVNQSSGAGLVAVTDFKKEQLALIAVATSQLAYLPIQLDVLPYQLTNFNIIAPLGISGGVFFTRENGPIKTINDLEKILPTLSKGAIGVAAADAAANARAFVKSRNFNVPVVNFKSVNDVVTNVAGGHVDVGVAQMSTSMLWDLQESKQLRVLGVVSQGPWAKNGQIYPSINQTFNIPAFYSGAWLAITPGNSKEAQILKQAVLDALKDSELHVLMKESWPLGTTATLESIIDTANKHKDLIK